MASKPVVFGHDAARRIVGAVKRVEALPQFPPAAPPGGPRNWNPGVVEAIVGTAITAASGTTYGTGTATIYIDNGSGVAIADPAYPGPVTVLNWSQNSGTIGSGTHVGISWRNGAWRLSWADC